MIWNIIKGVGKLIIAAGDQAEKNHGRLVETEAKFEKRSDKELIEVMKDDSTFGATRTDKHAAFKVLKSRGYNPKELKDMMS